MSFSETPQVWRMRNAKMGRKTAAIGDARRAAFAQALQGTKNQGYANVAGIRNEGAFDVAEMKEQGFDRRLASTQKYGKPFQTASVSRFDADTERLGAEAGRLGADTARIGADTTRTNVGIAGDKMFNALTKEFGREYMLKDLGMGGSDPAMFGAGEAGAIPSSDAIQPSDAYPSELSPRTAISQSSPATVQGQGQEQGGGLGDTWDKLGRSPIGRAYDYKSQTEAMKYLWGILSRIGSGTVSGTKSLLNPGERRKKPRMITGIPSLDIKPLD